MRSNISRATLDRLPLYFRALRLLAEEGKAIVSSAELGIQLGFTSEQIRKDLACFGQFGKKGVGYIVQALMRNIGMILGLYCEWNIIVVGVGHLGNALINSRNLSNMGYRLRAAFDIDKNKIGMLDNRIPVYHISALPLVARTCKIHIGVIAVPELEAQLVANGLVEAGIKGIWNFSSQRIVVPEDVKVVNEDLSIGLSVLTFYLTDNSCNDRVNQFN